MALKQILESLDGLHDTIKSEYKKGDDGKFHLDVEGGEDTGALKRAKDHEKSARQKAEQLLQEAQDKLVELSDERDGLLRGAIPKGDVEKLEASWKSKLATREKELGDQIGVVHRYFSLSRRPAGRLVKSEWVARIRHHQSGQDCTRFRRVYPRSVG